MHRTFSDFSQAVRAAEAYAGAGFAVAMISATGRFLMGFEPGWHGDCRREKPGHAEPRFPEKTGRKRASAAKILEITRKSEPFSRNFSGCFRA